MFRKNRIHQRKEILLTKILYNQVYERSSEMMTRLRSKLYTLSVDDLSALSLIMEQKIREAKENTPCQQP